MTGTRTVVDLSHSISHGMTTYPGLPGPLIKDHLSRRDSEGLYAAGVTFNIGRIEMVGNTGTYLDSPFHRFADGDDLADLDIDRLVDVEGIVVEGGGSGPRGVEVAALEMFEVTGRAVLIHTGWDRHWGTAQYGQDPPYLTAAAAGWLAERSPAIVGIDSINIDDATDPARPAHSALLAAGVPIVEHLCHLGDLPTDGFRFTAVPPPITGLSSFPVRAVAVIPA